MMEPVAATLENLWDDLSQRAARLARGQAIRDAIDLTIEWQLRGIQPFVMQAIPHADTLRSKPKVSEADLAAPLGRIGAIFDALPWKFRRGGQAVPLLQRAPGGMAALRQEGAEWLGGAPAGRSPPILVGLGGEAWNVLQLIFPELPAWQPGAVCPCYDVTLKGHGVKIIPCQHPAAQGGAFSRSIEPLLVERLASAL